MSAEKPRWRKLTKLMAHHFFRHVDTDEYLAVVNEKRVTDELWSDRRSSSPCLNRLLRCRLRVNLFQQLLINEWALFQRP